MGGAVAGSGRVYQVLRHGDYRLLWAADGISSAGSQIQRVAVAWQVYQLTGDPFQLGLLGLVRFAPILLFGIAGGGVADRYDRRRTLIASQVALLLTSAALAAMTAAGSVNLPLVYAIVFLSATFGAVANPTRQALVPALVPRAEMAGAMAMSTLSFQVAGVAGPALGGILIGQFGVAAAYAVDAASFAAVVAALLAMRTRPPVSPQARGGIEAAVEGLRFLRRSPILLGVMGIDFAATFFGASTVLMPIFAEDVLGVGPTGLGLLLAAPAIGAVGGGVAMSWLRIPERAGAGVLAAVAAYGACILGFGLSRDLALSLAFLAGSGAADAVSMALRHTVRNLVTPDALRGRVAAAHSTFAMGGPQLGEFEAGAVAAVAGAGASVAIGGLATVLTSALVAWRVPSIAAYRTHDVELAAPTPAAAASGAPGTLDEASPPGASLHRRVEGRAD